MVSKNATRLRVDVVKDAKTVDATLPKTIRANGLTVMSTGVADAEHLTTLSKALILEIDVDLKKTVSIGEVEPSAEIKNIS